MHFRVEINGPFQICNPNSEAGVRKQVGEFQLAVWTSPLLHPLLPLTKDQARCCGEKSHNFSTFKKWGGGKCGYGMHH